MESRRENCKDAGEFNSDRLSNVPAEIIDAIFSFLDMDDISRVGILSKKLREVYLLSPYLKFGSTCKRRDGPSSALCLPSEGGRLCQQYTAKVDRLLSLRDGLAIRHLCLVWMCNVHSCGSDVSPVDKWIVAGESCLVQELDIQVGLRRGVSFSLPRTAFNYRSLRVLKLNLCYAKLGKPSSGVLCSLEDLTLESMEVDNPSLSEWISVDTCPLLKRLFLIDFRWIDDILYICDVSNIQELTIDEPQSCEILIGMEKLLSLDVDLTQLDTGTWSVLNISAPNLQCIRWKEKYHTVARCIVFHSLKTAYLDVKCDPVSTMATIEEKNIILNQLIHLLDSMHSARELQLNLEIIEILFFNNWLSVVFKELKHLVIAAKKLRDYHIHVLASIINRCPKLETLSLICNQKADGYEKVNWHANKFFKNHDGCDGLVRHKLSKIEIELQCITYDARLLEKMLKFVPCLKKMTLFCSREDQHKLSKIKMLSGKSLPHFEVKYI